MNISELARRMRISPKELRDVLPHMGFDVGQRAIKVDDSIAMRAQRLWPKFRREREAHRRQEEREAQRQQAVASAPETIQLPSIMTVHAFASFLKLPVSTVIRELMKSGILLSMNEHIDYETATIVAEDLGFSIERAEKGEDALTEAAPHEKERETNDVSETTYRAPVIVVMGHVDHGKTKLLDTIRKANVVDRESGGITQHIGAYQAHVDALRTKERRSLTEDIPAALHTLTFIDTPGHEAFTTMRSRGARVADIAILVVAADDGVQPQTIEALNIIRGAELPFIVALNKIDKPDVNIDRVKQQLSEQNVLVEGWGGTVPVVPLSAKSGQGVDDLLEVLVLVAATHKEDIRAARDVPARGTIIESHMNPGAGPVATVVIQEGVLRPADLLSVRNIFYGKVRALQDDRGKNIVEATPGMPVQIIGLKDTPHVGDELQVARDLRSLDRKQSRHALRQHGHTASSMTPHGRRDDQKRIKTLPLILKADVGGSLETIVLSLEKLRHPEARTQIVDQGLGEITEADILHAEGTRATVIGFHVEPSQSAMQFARDKEIPVKTYRVIYELLHDVEQMLNALLEDKVVEHVVGKIQVLKVFNERQTGWIIGGKVLSGKIHTQDLVRIVRKGEVIGQGSIQELRSGKEAVEEIVHGQESGLQVRTDTPIEEHDVLDVYREEKEKQTITTQ